MSLEGKQLEAVDVVGMAADLMFASRLRSAAKATGVNLMLVRAAAELPDRVRELEPRLVLVELDARAGDVTAAIRAIREASGSLPRIVAFGSHVEVDAIRAARDAGADEVLARSAFVKRLPQLLTA